MTQVVTYYVSAKPARQDTAAVVRTVLQDVGPIRADEALEKLGMRWVAICECPRGDCGIRAYGHHVGGPWQLLPEWAYVIADAPLTR
jgi:hypothetical protein